MKLLLENWRKYLNEDNERPDTVLTELTPDYDVPDRLKPSDPSYFEDFELSDAVPRSDADLFVLGSVEGTLGLHDIDQARTVRNNAMRVIKPTAATLADDPMALARRPGGVGKKALPAVAKSAGIRAGVTGLIAGGIGGIIGELGMKGAIAAIYAGQDGTSFAEAWEKMNNIENLPIAWLGGVFNTDMTADQAVNMQSALNKMGREKNPWTAQQAHAFYNIQMNKNDELGNDERLQALKDKTYKYKYMSPPEDFEGSEEEWRGKAS